MLVSMKWNTEQQQQQKDVNKNEKFLLTGLYF